jgi:hypothetical protein
VYLSSIKETSLREEKQTIFFSKFVMQLFFERVDNFRKEHSTFLKANTLLIKSSNSEQQKKRLTKMCSKILKQLPVDIAAILVYGTSKLHKPHSFLLLF